MKLDDRIILQTDILTCFDTERAEQFIGQKGYFSSDLRCFENLQSCWYGTLTAICVDKTGEGYAYLQDNNRYQDFFIPESSLRESSLKPVKKKFRPFASTEEFFRKTNFTECDLIHIRSKPNNFEYHLVLVGWTDNELMLGSLRSLSFDELFQRFELWDGEDKFIPFGMEE